MSVQRDEIRSRFFSTEVASQLVPLKCGLSVEVREPTVEGQLNLTKIDDPQERMLRMFTQHVYVPGTEDLVFDSADFEQLRKQPAGGDYTAIVSAMNSMMNLAEATKDAAKNSAPTPASS